METLLQQILAVQNEMLAAHREILEEVRLLRRTLEQGAAAPAAKTPATVGEAAPQASTETPPAPAETPQPAPTAQAAPAQERPAAATPPPAPRKRSRGMLTLDELTDLGGEFLDADPRPKPRVKPTDASDLVDEIKAKNRAKRNAFAEFDRSRRDR